MNPADKEKSAQLFAAIRAEAEKRRNAYREAPVPKIHIGMATCGIASGALETKKAFEEALAERNIDALIHCIGCIGHCYAEPVVIIDHQDSGFPPIFYPEVNAGKAKMLVKLFLEQGDPRFEHVLGAMEENDLIPSVMDFSRFNLEKRIVMEQCGFIDPEDIYDYIAADGYSTLLKALQTQPDGIINQIQGAGLRGRGGCRISHGKKVGISPSRHRPGKNSDLQCRRGRSRRLHGSNHSRKQPASGS